FIDNVIFKVRSSFGDLSAFKRSEIQIIDVCERLGETLAIKMYIKILGSLSTSVGETITH
ncbi:hypothetical protein, partial [Staphylococcus pseudintermedius]|uniref:hypothetical protein n=1 Tax=Staphylococcus pseudintermedius TaxID=283734 RepID=UPI000E36390A